MKKKNNNNEMEERSKVQLFDDKKLRLKKDFLVGESTTAVR